MGLAQRLWMLANMYLVYLFGYLLGLGKFRSATTKNNSKINLPSLGDWSGVCWYIMDNNLSKAQLVHIYKNEERIYFLRAKVTENHKEMITHQKKLKPILEGMEKKK